MARSPVSRGFKPRAKTPRTARIAPEAGAEARLAWVLQAHASGTLAQPLQAYRELLQAGLHHPLVLANLAQLEFHAGDLDGAAEHLRSALKLEPAQAAFWALLGTVERRRGHGQAARECLERALSLDAGHFPAWLALSVLLHDMGELQPALKACQRALALDAGSAAAHANRAMVQLALADPQAAEASARQAIQRDASLPEAHLNLGNALHALQDWHGALAAHRQALHLRPAFPQALMGAGNALRAMDQLADAAELFRQAIEIQPAYYQAHSNLAITLRAQGELTKALQHARQALSLCPASADVLSNAAVIYHEIGDLDSSKHYFSQAISLQVDHADARFGLAMVLLQLSDYQQGWAEYEWRFAHNHLNPIVREIPELDRWQGPGSACVGDLIVLHEQGLGDTFQFIRFVSHLRGYARRVIFACPEPLRSLISQSGLADQVVALDVNAEQLDPGSQWVPLLSLPGLLAIDPDQFARPCPYLPVEAARVRGWRQRLRPDRLERSARLIVGLNWQGNPEHEKNVSRGRSVPLEAFAPLAEFDDVLFLSLQKGFGSEQLASCSFRHRFVSCQDEIDAAWDFEDAAALMRCCDLIISSDTSAAHLAGATSAPLWIALKHVPEWRWGLQTESSPWYPTARLFRQTTAGDWTAPVAAMAAALPQVRPRVSTSARRSSPAQG